MRAVVEAEMEEDWPEVLDAHDTAEFLHITVAEVRRKTKNRALDWPMPEPDEQWRRVDLERYWMMLGRASNRWKDLEATSTTRIALEVMATHETWKRSQTAENLHAWSQATEKLSAIYEYWFDMLQKRKEIRQSP